MSTNISVTMSQKHPPIHTHTHTNICFCCVKDFFLRHRSFLNARFNTHTHIHTHTHTDIHTQAHKHKLTLRRCFSVTFYLATFPLLHAGSLKTLSIPSIPPPPSPKAELSSFCIF